MAMFGAILILFVLPWLDTSKVRSMRYRPIARQLFVLFVLGCVGLGFCGANDPDSLLVKTANDKLAVNYTDANGVAQSQVFDDFAAAQNLVRSLPATSGAGIEVKTTGIKWLWVSQTLTAYYFLYFLVVLPVLGVIEKPKPRPASIADSVRKRHHGDGKAAAPVGGAAPQHAE
jgi:ubiquinol-cytochrome c reductase cytochrome b subunit